MSVVSLVMYVKKNNITRLLLLFFKLLKNWHNSSTTQDMQHAPHISMVPGQHIKKLQSPGIIFAGFSASTSGFLCQYHSSKAP